MRYHGEKEIELACKNLELPTYIKRIVLDYLDKSRKKRCFFYYDDNFLGLGCLYLACKLHQEPLTHIEVEKETAHDFTGITDVYKKLVREFDIFIKPIPPEKYAKKYMKKLNLSFDIQKQVLYLINKVREQRTNFVCKPSKFAAGVVYFCCLTSGEPISQRKMGDVANTNEHFKPIVDYLINNVVN